MKIIEIKDIEINKKKVSFDIEPKDKILVKTNQRNDFNFDDIKEGKFEYKNRNVLTMYKKEKENILKNKISIIEKKINEKKSVLSLFIEEIKNSTNLKEIVKDNILTHAKEKYNYYKLHKNDYINNLVKEKNLSFLDAKEKYKLLQKENKRKIIIKKYEVLNEIEVLKVEYALPYIDNLEYKKDKNYLKNFKYSKLDIQTEIKELLGIFKLNENILKRKYNELNEESKKEIRILLSFAGKKDIVIAKEKLTSLQLDRIFNILKTRDTSFIYLSKEEDNRFNKVINLL